MSIEHQLPDPDEVLLIAEAIIFDESIRRENEIADQRDLEELAERMDRKLERVEKRRERRKRFGVWVTENLIEIGNSMSPVAGLKAAYKMAVPDEQPGDAEPGTV